MLRKPGLIGILLTLFVAFISSPAAAQVQTGSMFVKAADEQGAAIPGATLTLTGPVLPQPMTGVTDATGVYRFPSLSVATYTLKIALAGFQTVTRENVVVVQTPDDHDRLRPEGGLGRRRSHRARRNARRRHEERECQHQPRRQAARVHARRQGHLEHPRVQGAGSDLRHAGRRRQPGRTAARLHRAGHAEQPECATAERRQRRRSGRHRLLDELLRPDVVPEHPGHDGRAGHLARHVGRLDQHGHQERAPTVSPARSCRPTRARRRSGTTSIIAQGRRVSGRTPTRRSC